ncbi:MAG: hypothetical protein ACRDAX_02785 [Propionibacteriaceae bacterium]
MPRKVSLPGAAELFRPTKTDKIKQSSQSSEAVATADGSDELKPTGRVRHDSKITVYVSQEELLGLEQARLTLRANFGVAVDRGRIVREAIAAALADLETQGEESQLVTRLTS